MNGSSTHNIYGIYDLVGGRSEYSAAYYDGYTESNNSLITDGNTKYCTKYSIPSTGTIEEKIKNASKIGDAIGETYFWNYNAVRKVNTGTGNYFTTANPTLISTSAPYILRGGGQSNGYNGGGIMSFWAIETGTSYFREFRTILIIE